MQNLEIKINKLEEENKYLRIEIQNLINENTQLKDKLGLNSKNSSLPSSKDLYKIVKEKSKSINKIGAQLGHKGHKRVILEADKIIKVNDLPELCECGGEIALAKPYIHQNIDLPEIKPLVTEYHMQRGRCRKCGRRKSSSLPRGIENNLFGPRIKSIISALTAFYKNSKQEVVNILQDIFNLNISIGSISNNENRVSKKCKKKYEKIEEEISKASIVHMDETSHYQKDKINWCWLFSSKTETLIKFDKSRKMKVLKNSLFDEETFVITDRYAAYNYFKQENRQVCWAHLARDFERFANSVNGEVKIIGEHLRNLVKEIFELKKSLSQKEINISDFKNKNVELRKKTWNNLEKLAYLENSIQVNRVAKHMLKSENMMWRFLDDPINIPLTNNHAERQIRHYVVYRKNSYFTQSERGNRFLERTISLYLTWKQRKENPFENLTKLVIC